MKTEFIKHENRCKQIEKILRNIFLAKPNWKLRNKKASDGLYASILQAVEDITSDLVPTTSEHHPVVYKNSLIILPWVNDLPDVEEDNDIKKNKDTIILRSSWNQFRTLGTKNQSAFQKALYQHHGVRLKASVTIDFDMNGIIVINQPWTEGFVWQMKIPYHSRMTLNDTPWKNKIENDVIIKNFDVPKTFSNFAIRLAFIKADKSTVPLSNVIYGSDITRKIKSIAHRIPYGDIYEDYRQKLTMKARELLGIPNKEEIFNKEYEIERLQTTIDDTKKRQNKQRKEILVKLEQVREELKTVDLQQKT